MALGKVGTYDLTVGVIVDIEDVIHLISPTDVPLLGGQGAGGETVLAAGTCFEKKVEWLDENLLLPKSTAAATATTTEGVLTVASGHQTRFSTGDELLLGSNERVRVTGYGTTADTLLVTRAFDGSTGATIATSATVTVIARTLAEGSDPENARSIDRNNRFNITQIFGPDAVHVTGTEKVVRKYGLGGTNEFDKQAANRTKEQYIAVEQALLYGRRIEDVTNKWRAMGGLAYYISTNTDTTTTTITEAKTLDQLQNCYDAGGSPDRAVMGSKTKRVFSGLAAGITVNAARPDPARGTVVDYFDSDFGRVTMIMDRWCRTPDLFLFNRDQAEVLTLRPMQFEMLSKTGDSVKGQVLCEKTFRFRREQHAAMFTALT